MTANNPIQSLLDQLRRDFLAELPGRIQEIESLILGQAKNDNYEEIYRLVHSLKGGGGTHGIQIISVICHQLESYLEKQQETDNLGSTECIDHCLKHIDLLIKTHEQASEGKNKFTEIEKRLNNISNSFSDHKYSMLLVESSRLQVNLIKQFLSSLPLAIDTHNNGLKALELLLHKKYDIIITGMEVDELNGAALVAAMRLSKTVNRDTKSILLTTKKFHNPKRNIDPDKIIMRSTDINQQLKDVVLELLKPIK